MSNTMETSSGDLPSESSAKTSADKNSTSDFSSQDNAGSHLASKLSVSGVSSWARSFKFPQQLGGEAAHPKEGNAIMSTFERFTGGFGLRAPSATSEPKKDSAATTAQYGVVESLTKGIVDSSRSAVKAVQVKARHIVSQNKRRYQEGGFDLDMTYITENVIAMGFPAGDLSSGLFGYLEGFYRNHMEEVIKFFESHHQGKYKVYNLCSERLYDASLFEGKVANFPFDDHNCPPLHLIKSFCQSAYSWLKDDIENVVVVHCKAGMGRTGLMICCLLLFIKMFPTAEEAINYFNQKRCIDGKALVLPSQIRYVKYFESTLTSSNGENHQGRRCMLRGFRIYKCPNWLRPSITISDHKGILFSSRKHPKTKDLMPEDFWLRATKKGFVVFALPGEPGLTEVVGDFKIHFQHRQGDFYCWLNTAMIENRTFLNANDLDGFEKRNLYIPGFQVEVVMIDYDGTTSKSVAASSGKPSNSSSAATSQASINDVSAPASNSKEDTDDVFSDSDGEDIKPTKSVSARPAQKSIMSEQIATLGDSAAQLSLNTETCASKELNDGDLRPSMGMETQRQEQSDFKAISADVSVFSFGDEDDLESD